MTVYDTQNADTRDEALDAAVETVREGRLIVLPTDTVYGIGADAFTPEAVEALQEAKGRGRETPPPVLIGDQAVVLALALDVPEYVERLTEEFWPGPLTLIVNAQSTLSWDLGETRGTVALRMPDDEVALDLLRRTGPLAVSSANRHGKPPATTVLDAATQLGDRVDVYLDGGPSRGGEASTIIDTTVEPAEIVRLGALSQEQIEAKVGPIFTAPEPPEDLEEDADAGADAADADSEDADASSDQTAESDVTDAAAESDAAAGSDSGATPEADGRVDPEASPVPGEDAATAETSRAPSDDAAPSGEAAPAGLDLPRETPESSASAAADDEDSPG